MFEVPTHKIALDEVFEYLRYRFEDTKYTADDLANNEFSVFTPLYTNLDDVPSEYKNDSLEYDRNSAYWKYRSVSELATTNRERYSKLVRDKYKELETKWMENLDKMDEEYEKGYERPEVATKIFNDVATEAMGAADELFSKLVERLAIDQIDDSRRFGKDIE